MGNEEVLSVSAVILVCNGKFCSIAGDTRCMSYKDEEKVLSNKFHKVFKLNANVIYGVTGQFYQSSDLRPFKYRPINDQNFYIEDAVLWVKQWRQTQKNLPPLTFFLAGKGRPGKIAGAILSFSAGSRECKSDLYVPGDKEYWVRCSAPNSSDEKIKSILYNKIEKTMPYPTVEMLTAHMKNAIKDISKIDRTVNSNIEVQTISPLY